MSIAVSVVVRPSSGLRVAHAGLCCCVLASAAACPGVLAPLLCLLAGVLGWWCGRAPPIARQLDLTEPGHLRLAVYQQIGTAQRLLDGSTLWPRLLLLRLADGEGRVQALVLLPDCVAPDDWRALAVACRAAAMHSEINTPAV